MKGDERQRTVGISYETVDNGYNGNPGHVNVGEYTSSGQTDGFEEARGILGFITKNSQNDTHVYFEYKTHANGKAKYQEKN